MKILNFQQSCCINFMKQVEQAVQEYTGDKDIELSGIWTHKTELMVVLSSVVQVVSISLFIIRSVWDKAVYIPVFVNDIPKI